MRTVVPFDYQGRQSFLRSPHVVGHDGDRVVELYNLTHPFDCFGRRISYALHTTTEDGRLRKGRDLHPRRLNIDAIDSRSVDLGWRIQPLGWSADELAILRSFESHAFGDGHAGGVGGKFAIFGASPGRRVTDFTALRVAGRRIDIPALCRRRYQHSFRDRTGLAQRLPRPAYRVRVAGCLHSQQRIGVELFIWRRMLDLHLLEIDLKLFGD